MSGNLGSLGQATVDVKADLTDIDALPGKLAPKFSAMSSRVDASMSGMRSGFKNTGMAALEFSRAVEDVQYGLNGVINNIPGLVMALGGGMGLTAAISLGAVAVNQLVKHWEDLTNALGMGATLTEAERMDKLAKATEKTAAATEKLRKYKEQTATIEAQEGEKSKAEKATAEAVHEAVVGPNREDIIKGLAEAGREQLIAGNEDARNAADKADAAERKIRFGKIPTVKGQDATYTRTRTPEEVEKELRDNKDYNTLKADLDEKLIAAAKKLLADAENSPDRLKALTGIVRDNMSSFPAGTHTALAHAPEALARKEQEKADEKEAKRGIDAMDDFYDALHDANKADKKKAFEATDLFFEDIKDANKKDKKHGFEAADLFFEDIQDANKRDKKHAFEAMGDYIDAEFDYKKHKPKAELMDTQSFLSKIATAGQSKADRTPDLIAEGNKVAAKIAENTQKLVEMGPPQAKFRKNR